MSKHQHTDIHYKIRKKEEQMMSPHMCQSDLKRLWYDPNLKATNIQMRDREVDQV